MPRVKIDRCLKAYPYGELILKILHDWNLLSMIERTDALRLEDIKLFEGFIAVLAERQGKYIIVDQTWDPRHIYNISFEEAYKNTFKYSLQFSSRKELHKYLETVPEKSRDRERVWCMARDAGIIKHKGKVPPVPKAWRLLEGERLY